MRLYTFSPMVPELPTSGPFGLKLEACLRLMKVPYERVYEDDNRKGPKRKSPWIVDGDVKLGDTELILAYVRERYGATIDDELTPIERARGLVIRRAFEEHYHQVVEYELFVLDAGWASVYAQIKKAVPGVVAPMVGRLVRGKFKSHLFERGIARHSAAEVEAMGKADLDAFAALIDGREWFVSDHPTKTDATAFGMLALCVLGGLETPVCRYARSLPPIAAFVERARTTFFPELADTKTSRAAS